MDQLFDVLLNSTGEVSESVLITTMMSMLLLSGVCAIIFNKLKMPPIIGYLIAGILIVNVFNLKESENFSMETVSVLKSIGLVMLMFGIGMELNMEKLKKTGKFAIIVAVIQLPLMVMSGYFFGMIIFGLDSVSAITLGAVISGSSTAVVAAVLGSQGRMSKEDVETLILVTVMEDIGQVIILSMVTPLFAGSSINTMEMIKLIILIIVFMVACLTIGVKFVPKVLDWIGNNTSAEVLLIFSIGLCFTLAWMSVAVGMSMAIGAFLMGVMVSQSKFSKDLGEKTEPMKEVFMAVFFIAVGMEVSFSKFVDTLPMAIGFCLLFMISKLVTVYIGYFIGGKNAETSFVSSVSLMAMGEFAFIIALEAKNKGAVTEDFYTAVIGAALISMIVLPLITKRMYNVVDRANTKCPSWLSKLGKFAYGTRDEINAKIESSPTMEQVMKKNLKKTYFCIILIIIIEIVFSGLSYEIQKFFVALINEFVQINNIEYYVYIGVMVANLLLLLYPTLALIRSIKVIDKALIEGEEHVIEKSKDEDKEKIKKTYWRILNFSTFALVLFIDLIIMSIVPGPFGTSDKSSMIVIPIAIAIFVIAFLLARKKENEEKTESLEENQ